jgi:hypothetical protein
LTSLTESSTDSYIKNDEVVKPTNNEEWTEIRKTKTIIIFLELMRNSKAQS